METVYIALGSNLGDREANLRRAIEQLAPEVTITKCSSLYESAPMYEVDQPGFLNAVVQGETALPAADLFKKMKQVEGEMGGHEHNKPRVIDLDLVFYGNERIDSQELIVPHPNYRERDFVLVPLLEITSALRDPISGASLKDLLDAIPEDRRTIFDRA